jgi:hypothetical protein
MENCPGPLHPHPHPHPHPQLSLYRERPGSLRWARFYSDQARQRYSLGPLSLILEPCFLGEPTVGHHVAFWMSWVPYYKCCDLEHLNRWLMASRPGPAAVMLEFWCGLCRAASNSLGTFLVSCPREPPSWWWEVSRIPSIKGKTCTLGFHGSFGAPELDTLYQS